MPGGSSAAKDEPDHPGVSSSLWGATGGPAGSVNQGKCLADSRVESPVIMHAVASVFEGTHLQEKYSLLIHVTTARDRQALEPPA